MFQGLRQNSPLYILEKGENPTMKVGFVESVSNPTPKNGNFNKVPMFGQTIEMVVDVKVRIGDVVHNIEGLPAAKTFTTPDENPNVFVTDSREVMLTEVENMIQASRSVLDSVNYHTSIVTACEGMLRELNPQMAKEQERDKEIGDLRDRIGGIESSLGSIESLLRTLNAGVAKEKRSHESND